MGRAGSRSGGSRGGSSRSHSRSGSGHRSSSRSSSRAGTSSSRSSFGSSSFGGNRSGGFGHSHGHHSPPPPPRPQRPPRYHGGYSGGYSRGYSSGYRTSRTSSGFITKLVTIIIVIVVLTNLFQILSLGSVLGFGSDSVTTSSYDREKANVNSSFNSDCIIDEIGWFDNARTAGKELQYFYEETGVQPYIVFEAYDATLTSDADKEAYAEQYYEENIDDEGTFLWMYFAEENIDDVGYMYCVCGYEITSVMDNEAQDIFWDYVDTYWYSDLSTDDMAKQIFSKTADRIMTKTTNGFDSIITIVIVGGIVGVAIIGLKALKAKHKRDKEKAEEDERILNTPLNTDVSDSTLDKYKE